MNTGEQRERGIELLELKQHYKKSGFEVTDKELPDYLPLLLEFFANANEQDSEPIMSKYKENIQALHVQLKEAGSMYKPILAAVLLAIDTWGCTDKLERRVVKMMDQFLWVLFPYIIFCNLYRWTYFLDTTMINLDGHQNLVNY